MREGGHLAYKAQEEVISEHPRLLEQHREMEGRSPNTGLPPAPKETGGKASQKTDNHEELVESILLLGWKLLINVVLVRELLVKSSH